MIELFKTIISLSISNRYHYVVVLGTGVGSPFGAAVVGVLGVAEGACEMDGLFDGTLDGVTVDGAGVSKHPTSELGPPTWPGKHRHSNPPSCCWQKVPGDGQTLLDEMQYGMG